MKILVTGATGFVGSRITSELARHGHDVIAVGGTRSSAQYSVNVADSGSVEQLVAIKGVDVIVHTAGLAHRFAKVSDSDFHSVNVNGVENVANLAVKLGVRHFLLFSSTMVYGRRVVSSTITEEHECFPADVYALSKLQGEQVAKRVCEENSIDLTIFRPSPIIGEGSKGNFARLIRAIDRRRFAMIGTGINKKSLIYVGDVAQATAEVIKQGGAKTQIFNLTSESVKIKDIVGLIEKGLGKKVLPFALPPTPIRLTLHVASKVLLRERLRKLSSTLDTWLANDVYSNDKLKATYGFVPQTDIETAIRLEVEFYLKRK